MRNDSPTVNGICVSVNNCVTREVQVFRVQKKTTARQIKAVSVQETFCLQALY